MNVSFGAKLITPPENFCLPTDTPAERNNIKTMFKEIDGFLSMPEVDKFTKGDTVELVRKKTKNLFKYEILYKSDTPLHENITKGIKMNFGNQKTFGSLHTIFQIANVVYYKRGKLPKISGNFTEHIGGAFDMNSKQLLAAVSRMLKNIL